MPQTLTVLAEIEQIFLKFLHLLYALRKMSETLTIGL